MMVALIDSKCFKKCLNTNDIKVSKKFYDIIYNDSNKVLFSRKYIEHLEKLIPNSDLFQALLMELNDKNRIVVETTSLSSTVDEEYLEIYKNSNLTFLFPITYSNEVAYSVIKDGKVSKISNSSIKGRIIDSLFTKGTYAASYQDFENDSDISDFFNELFKIPRSIQEVVIFDRQITGTLLNGIKGKKISYYSLLRDRSALAKIEAKNLLKDCLGAKAKLYCTGNARLIHERKILIESLIITSDNSLDNLTVKEPTWEINISSDQTKASTWKAKCVQFIELR